MNLPSKTIQYAVAALAVMLVGAAYSPNARADNWNQETIVTFSAPVAIPGKVLLPGTYIFNVGTSIAFRNVVRIYSKDGNICAALVTIPAYRSKVTGKPVIALKETTTDAPPAVWKWFYPGREYGHEFLYLGSQAQGVAKAKSTKAPLASVRAG